MSTYINRENDFSNLLSATEMSAEHTHPQDASICYECISVLSPRMHYASYQIRYNYYNNIMLPLIWGTRLQLQRTILDTKQDGN